MKDILLQCCALTSEHADTTLSLKMYLSTYVVEMIFNSTYKLPSSQLISVHEIAFTFLPNREGIDVSVVKEDPIVERLINLLGNPKKTKVLSELRAYLE